MKHLTKLSALLLVLLVVSLCLLVSPGKAQAADDGVYSYEVTDGKATITGSVTPLTGPIVIPSTLDGYPVTAIGASAFRKCTGLTAVTIPDSVVTIGDTAFCECTGLTSITIPAGVTTIGHSAFSWCTGLNTVILSDGVTTISNYAFYWCNALTSVTYCGTPEQWEKVYVGSYNNNFEGAAFSFHNWVPASCAAPKTCTICGTIEGTAAHHGDFWFEVLKPTCSAAGIKARICEKCGTTETVAIPALSHDYTQTVVEPTCTQQGYTAYICENCNDRYFDSYVAANGHSWSEWETITKPTCTQPGKQERACTCGTVESLDIPAAGHSWSNWEAVTAPTCTQPGKQERACTCGAVEALDIPVLGHSYSETVTAPTCDQKGYTTHTCGNCGNSYTDTFVAATGHKWSAWIPLAAPNCTQDSSELRFCNCGASETQIIPKLPHTYTDGKCTGCNKVMGGYVILTADTHLTGLTLEEDLYIDLNGFDLTGKITTGNYKIYGMDSTTNSYTANNVGLFSCVDETGAPVVPAAHFKSDITGSTKRYMALEAEGGYTFHRIYLAITKVRIRTSETGFGYNAVFYADETVLSQLDSFGFIANLSGHTKEISQSMAGSKLQIGKEYSMLLRNFDIENLGTTAVNAQVFLKLKNGETITSSTVSYSMKTALQMVCESLSTLSQSSLRALRTMCLPFKEIMNSWNIDALLSEE